MPIATRLDHYLDVAGGTNRGRRAFAKRVDMTLKRAGRNSSRVARSLGVTEGLVGLWRAGVMMPSGDECRRLAALLCVDLRWLCGVDASAFPSDQALAA